MFDVVRLAVDEPSLFLLDRDQPIAVVDPSARRLIAHRPLGMHVTGPKQSAVMSSAEPSRIVRAPAGRDGALSPAVRSKGFVTPNLTRARKAEIVAMTKATLRGLAAARSHGTRWSVRQ